MPNVPKQPIVYDLQVTCVEAYTPSGSIIASPSSGKTLTYAFYMTDIDGTVTVQTYFGNTVTLPAKGGVVYPFAVQKITSTTATNVYICHNQY